MIKNPENTGSSGINVQVIPAKPSGLAQAVIDNRTEIVGLKTRVDDLKQTNLGMDQQLIELGQRIGSLEQAK